MGLRVGFLGCFDTKKWEDSQHLYEKAIGNKEDKWTIFKCNKGEFPSEDEIKNKFEVFVISGSLYSANDTQTDWINELVKVIKEINFRGKRIVGICFGCQIVARALKGEVGTSTGAQFVLKVETINLSDKLQKLLKEHFKWSEDKKQLKMIESHGEQVVTLPPGSTVLADSETAFYEIFGVNDNVVCCQGHPEFDNEMTIEKVCNYMVSNKCQTFDQNQDSLGSLKHDKHDHECFNYFLRYFMEHGLDFMEHKDLEFDLLSNIQSITTALQQQNQPLLDSLIVQMENNIKYAQKYQKLSWDWKQNKDLVKNNLHLQQRIHTYQDKLTQQGNELAQLDNDIERIETQVNKIYQYVHQNFYLRQAQKFQ